MENDLYDGEVNGMRMLTREELVEWLAEAYMAGFENPPTLMYGIKEAKVAAISWATIQVDREE